jgi:hypothetical protein
MLDSNAISKAEIKADFGLTIESPVSLDMTFW